MRMRILLAAAVIAVVAASLVPASAGPTACDTDPSCSSGRGHIAGYACWRNEAQVDTFAGVGVGRICDRHPDGGDTYIYTRGISNRHPLVICEDGKRVYPEPYPHEANAHYECTAMR